MNILESLLEKAESLSGPLKNGEGRLYGTYHFNGLNKKNNKALRNTLKRYNLFGIPKDLSDYKILDLGSNTGALSLEASRRNVSYVLGLEYNMQRVDLCRDISSALGLNNTEFKQCDFNKDWSLDQKFDIVFCCAIDRYLEDKQKLYESIKQYTKSICYLEINSPKAIVNEIKDIFRNDFNVEFIGELEAGRKNFILTKNETPYPAYCLSMVPPAQCKNWKDKDFYYKKLQKKSQYNFIKYNFEKLKNHPNILEINFLQDNVISTRNLKECRKWSRNDKFCKSLANVIKFLNSLGLSHGDLMPKNLLISENDLKVIDFELLFPDVCSLENSVDVVGLPSMHYNLDLYKKPVIVSSKTAFGNMQNSFIFQPNIKML